MGHRQLSAGLRAHSRRCHAKATHCCGDPHPVPWGNCREFREQHFKTFFGTGFVPSERDRMKQWNEYGTGSQGLKRSGLKDNDLTQGITGAGLVRILGLCDRLHLEDCPAAPKLVAETLPPSISAASAPPPDLSELASRDKPPDDRQ